MGVLIREKDDADPSASDDGDLEDDIINDKTQICGRLCSLVRDAVPPNQKSRKGPNQQIGKKARMENYQR